VQVTDTSGKPVTGLTPDKFTVLDGHRPQKIAGFREVDGQAFSADVHVILVLDAVNDGGSAIGHLRRDLGRFLSQGDGPLQYPFSLVSLSDAGVTQTQPSTDRNMVAAELMQLSRRPRSAECDQEGSDVGNQSTGVRKQEQGNCMDDHFNKSITALRNLLGEQENVRGRAILIWAGPGWPLLTDYGAGPGPGARQGNFRDVLSALTTNLREAQVTLDALSWGIFEHPRDLHKPIASVTHRVATTPDELAEESMALPALAGANGGQAIANVKNFAETINGFLAGADRFYSLSYDSAPAATADEFRLIEVKVDRPGVTVRTATRYYAQP
jgi:VWFA-related protein